MGYVMLCKPEWCDINERRVLLKYDPCHHHQTDSRLRVVQMKGSKKSGWQEVSGLCQWDPISLIVKMCVYSADVCLPDLVTDSVSLIATYDIFSCNKRYIKIMKWIDRNVILRYVERKKARTYHMSERCTNICGGLIGYPLILLSISPASMINTITTSLYILTRYHIMFCFLSYPVFRWKPIHYSCNLRVRQKEKKSKNQKGYVMR